MCYSPSVTRITLSVRGAMTCNSCYSQSNYEPYVSLANKYTCMMNTLGQAKLEHLGLQSTFQEVLQTQTEHVVELHLGLIQYSDAHQPTQ